MGGLPLNSSPAVTDRTAKRQCGRWSEVLVGVCGNDRTIISSAQ